MPNQTYGKYEKPYWDKYDSSGNKIGAYKTLGSLSWKNEPTGKCPLCKKPYEFSYRIKNNQCFHDV